MAKHRAELDETQVDVQLRETEQRRAVLACADNIIMPIIAADGSTNSQDRATQAMPTAPEWRDEWRRPAPKRRQRPRSRGCSPA